MNPERITKLEAENQRLREALREAYEIYAGMDGFIPETAPEAYQATIISNMVGVIQKALEDE